MKLAHVVVLSPPFAGRATAQEVAGEVYCLATVSGRVSVKPAVAGVVYCLAAMAGNVGINAVTGNTLYAGQDNDIYLDRLHETASGDYVNDATVSFTVKSADGLTTIGSGSMTYTADSDGQYIGTLAYTASLVAGTTYRLDVTVNSQRLDRSYPQAQDNNQ